MGERGTAGPAVIVMARVPRPGEGKSRLRSAISDQGRQRLQEAFLRDAVEVAAEARVGPVHIAYTPPEARPWDESTFGDCVSTFAQQGEDLGARMLEAFRHVEAKGFSPLLMIGTDTPLLQPGHLRAALCALEGADVCLGPSADGGYYLLALRFVRPELFAAVPWGTSAVLETTLRLAGEASLEHSLLERLYDIDRPEDLTHLREDLAALPQEPSFRTARHTAEVLVGSKTKLPSDGVQSALERVGSAP